MNELREPGPPDREQPEDDRKPSPRIDTKLVIAVSASMVTVVIIIVVASLRFHHGECYDWAAEYDLLEQQISRYLTSQGSERAAALDEIEHLNLPCSKVAHSRDLCVHTYRNLDQADELRRRAKNALGRIEQSVLSLDEPWREVARRRFLDQQQPETIARELGLSEDEVNQRLAAADQKLRLNGVPALRQEFKRAVEQGDQLLEQAQRSNTDCERTFDRLREQRHR